MKSRDSVTFDAACSPECESHAISPLNRIKTRSRATWEAVVRGMESCRSSRPPKESSQNLSPLFRLPPEIRHEIWEHVFEPDPDSKAGHIHVYDKVFSACTYDPDLKKRNRDAPLQRISIMLTCKRLYEETVDYLWEKTHFQLVLFPGLARPQAQLKHIRSMGTLNEWSASLRRMRHATIVVQPGVKPELTKYKARIAEFLSALDSGRHLESAVVAFNLHKDMKDRETAVEVIASFKALQTNGRSSSPAVTLWGRPLQWSLDDSIDQLAKCVSNDDTVQGVSAIREVNRCPCSARGYYGGAYLSQYSEPLSAKEETAFTVFVWTVLGVGMLLSPISIPYWLHLERSRKRRKGEV